MARQISDEDVLTLVVERLATNKNFEKAESVARSMRHRQPMVTGLSRVARELLIAGHSARAEPLVSKVIDLVRTPEDNRGISRADDAALAALTEWAIAMRRWEHARALARRVSGYLRLKLFIRLAEQMHAAGEPEQALATLDEAEQSAIAAMGDFEYPRCV